MTRINVNKLADDSWEFTYKSVPFLLVDCYNAGDWVGLYKPVEEVPDVTDYLKHIKAPTENEYKYRGIGKYWNKNVWLTELNDGYLTLDEVDTGWLNAYLEDIEIIAHTRRVNKLKAIIKSCNNEIQPN